MNRIDRVPEADDAELVAESLRETAALPFGAARAMPKAAYTSPAFTAREEERIFSREWVAIAREEELEKTGAYVAAEVAGQPVFVARGEDGEIRAFANVCLHRMSTLLTGKGCVKRITCPYHGWTYGLDGQLRAASTMKGNEGFNIADYRLPEIRVERWCGWVLINLDRNAAPLAPALKGLTDEIADFSPELYRQSFRESFIWDTNWKVLAENFMESYHLHVCHAGTIGPVTDLSEMDTPPGEPAFNVHSILKKADAPLTNAHPDSTRLSGNRRRTTYIMTIYPSLLITLTPGYFWWLSLHPRGPGKVHVTYAGGLSPDYANDPASEKLFSDMKALLDAVNDEDKGCVERVYRGLCADLSTPGHLSPLERPLHEFATWIASRV